MTPKSLEGSSENAEIDRSGFASQSPGSDRCEEVEKGAEDEGSRSPRSVEVDCEVRTPWEEDRFEGEEMP